MGYQILKADLEKDREVILNFWKSNFPDWPEQKFVWFYLKNIYGPADCCLIKETQSNKVVGSTAVFPRLIYFEGKTLMAGITGDFGVDKNHRILGPALKLQKAAADLIRQGKYDLLYGYPNSNSEPVQIRAGYKTIGSSDRLVRIMRTENFINKLIPSSLLSEFLGKFLDVGLNLFARENRHGVSSEYHWGLLDKTDERFDLLWKGAVKHFRIIGERSNAFLTWRFVNCPFRKYEIFTVFRKTDDLLIGYVIYFHQNGVIHVADLLAEKPIILKNIIIPVFLKFMKTKKIDSISILFFGEDNFLNIFRQFHFIRRPEDRNVTILSGIKKKIKAEDFNPCDWYFTEADND